MSVRPDMDMDINGHKRCAKLEHYGIFMNTKKNVPNVLNCAECAECAECVECAECDECDTFLTRF